MLCQLHEIEQLLQDQDFCRDLQGRSKHIIGYSVNYRTHVGVKLFFYKHVLFLHQSPVVLCLVGHSNFVMKGHLFWFGLEMVECS